jgi:branched-chain amino acid aminotransferase
VQVSPAAALLSYGVGVFEGLKAQRSEAGVILLFRHRDNGIRMQKSAERLMMPGFPLEQFTAAVEGLVLKNERYVPPFGKGTFYVRPMQHAIEPKLGLGPCRRFWVLMFGSPVGSYFAGKDPDSRTGLRLQTLEQGRVAAGGTGSAKAVGNYAGGITLANLWKQRGFDDVLYLDARNLKYLTETSGSNVFVKLRNGPLVTPPLDDQILPGVTRDSAVQVARKVLNLQVEERPLSIDEVLESGEEMFCTGTAWTVRSIEEIVYREESYRFARTEVQKALLEEILSYQCGRKKDPFGWVQEIKK